MLVRKGGIVTHQVDVMGWSKKMLVTGITEKLRKEAVAV